MQPMTQSIKLPSVPALLLSGMCFLCFHHAYGEDRGAKPSPAAAAQHGEAPSAQTEMPENKDTPASLDAATGGKAGATKAPGNNDVPAASEKKPRAEWTHITFPEVVQNECADFYPPEDIYDVMLQLYNHLDYECLYDAHTNNLEALMKIPVVTVNHVDDTDDRYMPGKFALVRKYQGDFFLMQLEGLYSNSDGIMISIRPYMSQFFFERSNNSFVIRDMFSLLPKPDKIFIPNKYGLIPRYIPETEEETRRREEKDRASLLGSRYNKIPNDHHNNPIIQDTTFYWFTKKGELRIWTGENTGNISVDFGRKF